MKRNRKCSYCHGEGHNIRSCKIKQKTRIDFANANIIYRRWFIELLKYNNIMLGDILEAKGVSYKGEKHNIKILLTRINFRKVKFFMPCHVFEFMPLGFFEKKLGSLNPRIVDIKDNDLRGYFAKKRREHLSSGTGKIVIHDTYYDFGENYDLFDGFFKQKDLDRRSIERMTKIRSKKCLNQLANMGVKI